MAKIIELKARQVFDSRGIPTVEAEIFLEGGGLGRFITPAGASVGKKEALELRDGDPSRFSGRGVERALSNIRTEIKKTVLNRVIAHQEELDHILIEVDGTPNKSRLGANAILAVSGAFFHAVAHQKQQPLYVSSRTKKAIMPLPLVNVINGGAHANNDLDIQEFMLVPSGANSFRDAMNMMAETFQALKSILEAEKMSTAVGDEGGFAPRIGRNEHALDLLLRAVEKAKFSPGVDIHFALDVAANEIYDEASGKYHLNQQLLDRNELLAWYEKMVSLYPIISIEDPFHEDDHVGFSSMVSSLGKKLQVVGDDLFVTNERLIREGIEHHYANAVLIKMNQIGTITETINATRLAQSAGFNAIISHRSGDSEDCTIADLAVFLDAGQIKTGSLSRSERVAKYNRLLRIEEELGERQVFEPWCRATRH